MTDTLRAGHVLIGLDGTPETRTAALWAARHAHDHDLQLLLLQAHHVAWPMPHARAMVAQVEEAEQRSAEENLWDVRALVTDEYPGLEVHTRMTNANPSLVLIQGSREAGLLVIGSNTRTLADAVLNGGAAERVVTSAHCPVVVVPAPSRIANAPVLLATDGGESSRAATQFAFENADRRGVALVALMVQDITSSGMDSYHRLSMVSADEAGQHLVRELAGFRSDFPEVPVRVRVTTGEVVETILDEARSASLLVCGSRGRGYLRGLVFGSTSRSCLRQTSTPAAVVPA